MPNMHIIMKTNKAKFL